MIRRLRGRHRLTVAILAVLLPLMLALAIRARRIAPPVRALPEPAAAEGRGR